MLLLLLLLVLDLYDVVFVGFVVVALCCGEREGVGESNGWIDAVECLSVHNDTALNTLSIF